MINSTRNDIALKEIFVWMVAAAATAVEESLIKLSKNWNLKRQNFLIIKFLERKIFQKIIIHFIENISLINFYSPHPTCHHATTRIAYSMETTSTHIKNIKFPDSRNINLSALLSSVGLIQGWAIIIILNSDTLQISSLPSATISSHSLTPYKIFLIECQKKVFLLLLISNIHAQHTIFVIFTPHHHHHSPLGVFSPCKSEKGLREWEDEIRLNFNIYNFGKYQDIGALSRTLLSIWWIQPPTAIASTGMRSALLYFKWFWFIVFVLFIKKTWNPCSMRSKRPPPPSCLPAFHYELFGAKGFNFR